MVSPGAERRPGWRRFAVASLVLLAAVGPSTALAASGGAAAGGKPPSKPPPRTHPATARALAGRGMWIWYVSQSAGGNLGSISSYSHRYGVSTLLIKGGDGTGTWSQFNRGLVSYLHSQGIQVCAWQYVYGRNPTAEAQVGAAAVSNGADCLLIDAESEYEGRYVQAQQYIQKLRQLIGPSFPVALASFPYVDYHPGEPYSVFMGPGGAQYNVPQMYWPDIQTSVDAVYSHSYRFNLPYARRIEPLGEVAGNPPPSQVERFRQLSRAYGADNVSWWDWQETAGREWQALSRPVGPLNVHPSTAWATLSTRSRGGLSSGDLVVWAQEHLYKAGFHIKIDGGFGPQTQRAVQQFQSAHRLPITGMVDTATWQALLRYPAVSVTWTSRGATVSRAHAAGGALVLPAPASAHQPATRYEIPAHLGRG